MAHYAFLDNSNIVTEVITGVDENEILEGKTPEEWYAEFRGQRCVRTSYNNNIRKNFAGIGYTYDETRDAFIAPRPALSWTLDEETCQWIPPVPRPAPACAYTWNENTYRWEKQHV